FDSHSYAKGGRILHMLRKTVGDNAFFKALNLYLTRNKFKTAEIHDLRLAFEEVTGQDLNWFFNQWFLASGHPKLKITHAYNDAEKKYSLTIKQTPSAENGPLYRLPIDVDIYEGGKVERKKIVLTNSEQIFDFTVNNKPDLVNVDAEKMLLCTKNEKKTNKEYAFQYKNAPLYLDRYEALDALSKDPSSSEAQEIIPLAINDKYWSIAKQAINLSSKLPKEKREPLKEKLRSIALTNPKSALREIAITKLADDYSANEFVPLFEQVLKNDSSYAVESACLYGLKKADNKKALEACKRMENEKNTNIILAIAGIYQEIGGKEQNAFFINSFKKLNGFTRYGLVQTYAMYLGKMDDETINNGLPVLENLARNEKTWFVRFAGIQALNGVAGSYEKKESELKNKIETATAEKNQSQINELNKQLTQAETQRKKIDQLVENIKKDEKDPNLTRFWNEK
ncbi:MAG: DUF3458 domain-containing protein, partial [Bacteroidia bacterium]|nr:DUF3458 domain-containing protein [Bacteroidia bacterium]